ncbi:MAG: hypothetical protein FWC34_09070 [Bacteroidetes bacterium]|nr:hypothetical protein [Bacteroidota bacterium]
MKLKDIYLLVEETAQAKMPHLQYIDLQKKQFERDTENYPIPVPALLVEFGGASFSNLAKHRQIGDSTVSIYFYQELVTDTFNKAELRDETIELLDSKEEIFQHFEGLKVDDTTQLVRQSESDFTFEKNNVWFKVTFSFAQYEKKKENTGKIKAIPVIIVET